MTEFLAEIRWAEDESRQGAGRLIGELLTYEQRAQDRPEMFAAGALYWPENGIIVDEQHNRQAPILRAVPNLDGKTLRIDAPIPNTQRGRDAATNIREGVFTGLSVTFHAETEERRSGLRVITRAALTRAGLVDIPSYKTAVEVRERESQHRRRHIWL